MGKLPLLKLVMMLVLLATVSATARAVAYGEFPDRPAPGKYVVLLASGADPVAVAADHHLPRAKTYRAAVNGFASTIPAHKLAALQADPRVSLVEQNRTYKVEAQTVPDGINRIEVDKNPYTSSIVDPAVTVTISQSIAIVDTGIDVDHPDLNVAGGYDAFGGTNYNDVQGHGTHVAGIAAAKDNDIGVAGVAPGASLWAIKVCDDSGFCDGVEMIAGLDQVAACKRKALGEDFICDMQPAGINFVSANMSIPTVDDPNPCTGTSNAVHEAVCGLYEAGVVLSISAGNGASTRQTFPEALGVSAMADYDGRAGGAGSNFICNLLYGAPDDTLAAISNTGPDIDLAAPGICVLSTAPGGGTVEQSGTSMAAPHAAGAIALYVEANSSSPAENGSGAQALMQAIVDAALPKDHACGYSNSRSSEPLLFTNGPSFGGDGDVAPCGPPPKPAAISDLSVSKLGADILLDWPAVMVDEQGQPISVDHYRIYRATEAYFSPSLTYSQTTSTIITDTGAVTHAPNYYYLVTSVSGGGIESAASNRVGKFMFDVLPGWNQITWPLLPYETNLDAVLAGQLHGANDPTAADRVLGWDGASQSYESAWYCGGPACESWGEPWANHWLAVDYSPSTLALEPDTGFWIQNRSGITETLVLLGAVSESDRSISVGQNWRVLGSAFPAAKPLDNANLPATGSDTPETADRVLYWDAETQDYRSAWYCGGPICEAWGEPLANHWLADDNSPTDIVLEPGHGFWYQNRHDAFVWSNLLGN